MNLPNGVSIYLSILGDDGWFSVDSENKYIGSIESGQSAVISVHVDPEAANRIFGIAIEHKTGAVQMKRDLSIDPIKELMIRKGTKWYETKVPVKDSKDLVPTTKYPQNYMALVELDAEKPGLVRIWEVALVSQKGVFWATTQCTYEVQCYRAGDVGGHLRCPFFQEEKARESLMALLDNLFGSTLDKLPPISEYRPPAISPKPWPDYGHVLWWNCAMQYGAILTTEGVARVHWSQLKDVSGLAYLAKDDIVTYGELGKPFQTYERETSLKLEALGVRKFVPTSSRVTESLATSPTT